MAVAVRNKARDASRAKARQTAEMFATDGFDFTKNGAWP